MDIIFHGLHEGDEVLNSVQCALTLLQERYRIQRFREMHLSVTLVDEAGQDVELVDSLTDHVYSVLDVCRDYHEGLRRIGPPGLKLVIDNTR
jgi:hypothetical protein